MPLAADPCPASLQTSPAARHTRIPTLESGINGGCGEGGVPMSQVGDGGRPRRSRWSSFVADPDENPSRILREIGNPDHRLRVEHDQQTLLIHLSDEDGHGWTVFAVDRRSREWA